MDLDPPAPSEDPRWLDAEDDWPGDTFPPEGWAPETNPDAESAIDRLRARVLHGDQVEHIAPPEPLIEGWLDLESVAVLYGRSGGGKSFVALDMALHIATGSWWYGHEVAPGPVLYIAAEGHRGLGVRQRAWKAHNGQQAHALDRMHWLPQRVRIIDPVEIAALIAVAEELRPKLIVFDTLARCMVGGDENSGKDMGQVIANADAVKAATGACVLLVHHTGKVESAGARGHSSLLGAVDTELELKSAENVLVLSTTKQKENAEQIPMRLKLMPAADSMAVGRLNNRDLTAEADVTSRHRITLDALGSVDTGRGATAAEWLTVAEEQGIKKPTFYRHRKQLLEMGLVVNIGSEERPRFQLGLPGSLMDEGAA
jgi:hypothetical protein